MTSGNSHALFELDEFVVVTTGTRTPRLLRDVPIKTELLSKDLFTAAGAIELGEALELLNGARIESNCQNCGTSEVQLLGLPGNYNQILVDGLPLFTGVASVYGIDQVPTIFIERIEVVKGGGSALYGPGAVAGVINLIPEEPYHSHSHAEINVRDIEGERIYQSQLVSFFVSDDRRFKASFYVLDGEQDAYDANGDGFTELVKRNNRTLGTYLWFTPIEKTRFRINYQYISEERRGGDRLNIPNQFAQISEYLDSDYHWGTIRWEQKISSDFSLNLSAAFVRLERGSFYGGTGSERVQPDDAKVNISTRTYNGAFGDGAAAVGSDAAKAFALFGDAVDGSGGGSFNQFGELKSTSWYVEGQFNYYAGNLGWSGQHNFVFGFQYEKESVNDANVNYVSDLINILQDNRFVNFGIYFQDEWALTDAIEIVPGIRIDKTNTLKERRVSPRVALRYRATDTLTFRANISSGFLAPRIFSEDAHVDNLGGQPVDTINAENLKEEGSLTYGLGLDYSPSRFAGKLITGLQMYYTVLEDSFYIEEPGSTPIIQDGRIKVKRINTDGTTVYGVEWQLSCTFNQHWGLNTGVAYNHTRYDQAQEVFDGVFSDKYNKTPDWTGFVQLDYRNEDWIDAFLAIKWTDTMEVASNTTSSIKNSPKFLVVDISISKSFQLSDRADLRLRLGVSNLLNEYQNDLERGADRDSDYVYGPRYPRSFVLGAKVEF